MSKFRAEMHKKLKEKGMETEINRDILIGILQLLSSKCDTQIGQNSPFIFDLRKDKAIKKAKSEAYQHMKDEIDKTISEI